MAENNIVTKEDLQNLVVQLTGLIKDTANNLKAEITAEMDRRFAESKDDMIKRFRRAERKQQKFQKEVEGQFHQVRSGMMIGFDEVKAQAEKTTKEHYRELFTLLDGFAGKAADLDLEQTTLGSEQDKLRVLVEENRKSSGAAIADLKQRVTVLEEKVFAEPAN